MKAIKYTYLVNRTMQAETNPVFMSRLFICILEETSNKCILASIAKFLGVFNVKAFHVLHLTRKLCTCIISGSGY